MNGPGLHVSYRIAVGLVLVSGCRSSPLAVRTGDSQTVNVAVGQELDVVLQTVGPGEYRSPPTISTGALRFINVAYVNPPIPAGVTQRFRFEGAAPGQAMVVFQSSEGAHVVTDTVNVK